MNWTSQEALAIAARYDAFGEGRKSRAMAQGWLKAAQRLAARERMSRVTLLRDELMNYGIAPW